MHFLTFWLHKLHQELEIELEKSRILETMNLSTDADSITIAMTRKKTLKGIIIFVLFLVFVNKKMMLGWKIMRTKLLYMFVLRSREKDYNSC